MSHLFLRACYLLLLAVPAAAQGPVALPIHEALRDTDGDHVPDRLGDTVWIAGMAVARARATDAGTSTISLHDPTGGIRLVAAGPALLADPVRPGDGLLVRGQIHQRRGADELIVVEVRRPRRRRIPGIPRPAAADLAPSHWAVGTLFLLSAVAVTASQRRRRRSAEARAREMERLNTQLTQEVRRSEEQLARHAYHDPLTGLANRVLFLDRVGYALARAATLPQAVSVLFLDLDNFKTVNDSRGHAEGDRLLVLAAERLRGCAREGDTIARLGGDEFAVLVEGDAPEQRAVVLAEQLGAALAVPFALDGRELFLSASIGIAVAAAGESRGELLRNADLAMYTAKAQGKEQCAVFRPEMHAAILARTELEADLRRAVEREEFHLVYQPIVRLGSGEVVGAEALLRWHHSERGAVPPAEFVPVAEELGLIVPIGRWVVREACRQARTWHRLGPGAPLRIAVNLSGRQLQDPQLARDVEAALRDAALDGKHLVLEITESMLMQNTEVTLSRLRELKRLGVSLAIDDFGTGYSSLGYLQRFPVDILKIDKSFVDAVGASGDPVLARAILALGDALHLQTIAEGVEGEHQVTGLRELGCELAQGYHFSRPLPAAALTELLTARRRCPVLLSA